MKSFKWSILVGMVALVLSGCGGGGGGDDDDIGGGPVQVGLPQLAIISVVENGPGRDIVVTVDITPPAGGLQPVGPVALAQTLTVPGIAADVLNNIVATNPGTPDRNGIIGLTAPATGVLRVIFTISGTTPAMVPAAAGIELEVRITDGFSQSMVTTMFTIDPFGPINEPTATFFSPTGGTLRGDVRLTADLADLEGNPSSGTYAFSTDGGATFVPCALVAGSSALLGPYTPTDPANTFAGASNQIVGAGTPSRVGVTWNTVASGVGLAARVRVQIRLLVEDGTTMAAGPFFGASTGFFVDNTPAGAAPATVQVVPLGNAALLDPRGILGNNRVFLGTTGRLRIPGMGFGPGSTPVLTPPDGIALGTTAVLASTLLEIPLRSLPDGPGVALPETSQVLILGARLVSVGPALAGSFDLANHGQLLSLSADRFLVPVGGSFRVAVQIPSGIQGGADPIVAFAADLRFDDGAVNVTAVSGGTHPDFSGIPTTIPAPFAAAQGSLVVFRDPVTRAQQAEPVMNVANVELTLTPGVISGTVIHVWLTPTSNDNVILSDSGTLVVGSHSLSILGTSILVQ